MGGRNKLLKQKIKARKIGEMEEKREGWNSFVWFASLQLKKKKRKKMYKEREEDSVNDAKRRRKSRKKKGV